MGPLITAEEVTIDNLVSRIETAGMLPERLDDMEARLHTEAGIGFRIRIEGDRQFLRLHTYLPTSRTKNRDEKLLFAHRLNQEIFLPTFCLDGDDDVLVNYVLPYQYGMVGEQFIALVRRFSSLLDYLVQAYDTNDMFDFGPPTVNGEIDEPQALIRTEGVLLH